MPFGLHAGGARRKKSYSLLPTFRSFKATRDPIIRESDLLHKTGISGNTIPLVTPIANPKQLVELQCSRQKDEVAKLK